MKIDTTKGNKIIVGVFLLKTIMRISYHALTAIKTSPSAGDAGFGIVITLSSRFPVNVCCTIIHLISTDEFAVVILCFIQRKYSINCWFFYSHRLAM